MRRRVLIADPDTRLLHEYEDHLTRNGFRVATASTGLECVAQLRRFTPDVLILEPDLPWGWGEGVLAMMYEEADVPLVPVMALTWRETPKGRCCVGVFPVGAYHLKPAAPDQLVEWVCQLLQKHRSVRRRRPRALR